ncbi:lipoprotein signal peptidase [Neisseria shayeganii]|uniref:Lipoprotein signal peptidase n=1 Tax=Neisseria shayeganii TaxID=607712 RepID=A0A7D7SR64_9NEIS|nr:lipoprotein signal peptidase [Neisseria shayeganii]
MQNPHLRRISALCAARSLAYLYDMSSLAALLRLELHPHLGVLQRSRYVCPTGIPGVHVRCAATP